MRSFIHSHFIRRSAAGSPCRLATPIPESKMTRLPASTSISEWKYRAVMPVRVNLHSLFSALTRILMVRRAAFSYHTSREQETVQAHVLRASLGCVIYCHEQGSWGVRAKLMQPGCHGRFRFKLWIIVEDFNKDCNSKEEEKQPLSPPTAADTTRPGKSCFQPHNTPWTLI